METGEVGEERLRLREGRGEREGIKKKKCLCPRTQCCIVEFAKFTGDKTILKSVS